MIHLLLQLQQQYCMCDEQAQGKRINISVNNIELNHSKVPLDAKQLLQENKQIRRQNVILKKQLQNLSSRLDTQIVKRLENVNKKQNNSDEISQLELQNSYKRCQIYKREALAYRKKYETLTEDARFVEFQRKKSEYEKENLNLKDEIKQLNKIVKLQSKGLTELGFQEYPSIVIQRDQLKEQMRILKKQLDQYRRSFDNKKKVKTHNSNFKDKNGESQDKIGIIKKEETIMEKMRKKFKSDQETIKDNLQDEPKLSRKRSEKDILKIKDLQAQRNKLRDMVDNLKVQLTEKQKQNSYLRDKINELRINNQLLQSQVVVKSVSHSKQNKINKIKPKPRYVESQHYQYATKQLKPGKVEKVKKKLMKKQIKSEPETIEVFNDKNSEYLLRREQSGNKGDNNLIKWSHQHLSSKIKQLQILEHQNGHIKDIHVRYVKGQPKKYNIGGSKNNYKVFTCSQNQYIKHVEGVFDQGYLQYLVVTSSYHRIEMYGKFQQYENAIYGEHFRFQVGSDEFPGALFGQRDQIGIKKLGCFVHKEV